MNSIEKEFHFLKLRKGIQFMFPKKVSVFLTYLLYFTAECQHIKVMKKVLLHSKKLLPGFMRRNHTPGTWSEWSAWDENCSQTCGIGFRRRSRTCNYAGYSKSKRCPGKSGELKNCDTKLTCPVHGGWTHWSSAGQCSASCGGGVGLMRRSCTNPRPMFDGKSCNGSSEEYGQCNKQKCPDEIYTLSPFTAQLVKIVTLKDPLIYKKKEGSFVRIPCNPELSSKMFEEYPNSILLWSRNGQLLKLESERMRLSLTEIIIDHVTAADNGVYVCSMRYAPGVVRALSLATILVTPSKPNLFVEEHQNVTLSCNAAELAKVYKDISTFWLHNESEVQHFNKSKDYNIELYASPNITGLWVCQVRNLQTSHEWITNSVYIQVLPSSPKSSKIPMPSDVVVLVGVSIATLCMCFGTCLTYRIHRARQHFNEYYEMWKDFVEYNNE